MPRYFFHVHDGQNIPDNEGVRLENWEAAQRQAIRCAGELIADRSSKFKLGESWSMEVTDENKLVLFRLDFYIGVSPVVPGPANN